MELIDFTDSEGLTKGTVKNWQGIHISSSVSTWLSREVMSLWSVGRLRNGLVLCVRGVDTTLALHMASADIRWILGWSG